MIESSFSRESLTRLGKQICGKCEKPEARFRCGKCLSINYCGITCQKSNAIFHKRHCKEPELVSAISTSFPLSTENPKEFVETISATHLSALTPEQRNALKELNPGLLAALNLFHPLTLNRFSVERLEAFSKTSIMKIVEMTTLNHAQLLERVRFFSQALECNPHNPVFLKIRGELYRRKREYHNAGLKRSMIVFHTF